MKFIFQISCILMTFVVKAKGSIYQENFEILSHPVHCTPVDLLVVEPLPQNLLTMVHGSALTDCRSLQM